MNRKKAALRRFLQIGGALTFFASVAIITAQPGRVDSSFNAPILSNYVSMWPKADGRLLVMAPQPQRTNNSAKQLLLLTENGAIDTSFTAALPENFVAVTAAPDPTERILVAGWFPDSQTNSQILRLLPSGALDSEFHATMDVPAALDWSIGLLSAQDSTVWVQGDFTNVNNQPRQVVARLNVDGTLDTGFRLQTNASYIVKSAIQGDNLLAVTAYFAPNSDVGELKFQRILRDGSVDPTFTPEQTNGGNQIENFFVDALGRILVAGVRFTPPNTRVVFWRLLADGSLDPAFQEIVGDGTIISVAFQPDGKIIVVGYFEKLNDIPRHSLARLNSDGAVDLTFDPGAWATLPYAYKCVTGTDGRTIVAFSQNSGPEATLVRFWGDQYLQLGSLALDGAGTAILTFSNTLNRSWVLETSADLLSWLPVATNEPAATQWTSSGGAGFARFFRGVIGQ